MIVQKSHSGCWHGQRRVGIQRRCIQCALIIVNRAAASAVAASGSEIFQHLPTTSREPALPVIILAPIVIRDHTTSQKQPYRTISASAPEPGAAAADQETAAELLGGRVTKQLAVVRSTACLSEPTLTSHHHLDSPSSSTHRSSICHRLLLNRSYRPRYRSVSQSISGTLVLPSPSLQLGAAVAVRHLSSKLKKDAGREALAEIEQ